MSDRERISSVKAYIEDHYDAALTISQLSKLACMSPSKLKYSFKAAFCRTVYGYLTEVRMRCAQCLLADTDLCVARVAERVGYKKAGAFAAAFRKYTGRLPREARKAAIRIQPCVRASDIL
jgi:AraC-like DNA-binding protein